MLSVTGLCTDYTDERGQAIHAAHEVAFEVPQGKLFTLLGPSGCGKTTTLRSIAGLERPRQGEISVGGDIVYSSQRGVFVAPNRRGLGMVFQSYAIWPHMTVFENAAFPLRVSKKRFSRQEIQERVSRVLKVVALEEMAGREATRLSGGQQQRLALARALALSHSIAVMNAGRIQQVGTPREIYERPGNQFVADFVGNTNFLDATVSAPAAPGYYRVSSALGEMKVRAVEALQPGEKVILSVRPEDIQLSETRPEGENVWEGSVDQKVFLGEAVDFQVKIRDRALQSRAHPSLRTRVGEPIYLRIDPDKCVALRASTT